MRRRHARPSQAGKLTKQATRIAPAVAVAGAMVGMPFHVKPPASRTTPVERVELTSSVKPASPAQVYVVRAGDTLWSIAQRFYGNPLMWSHIYYANESQINNPNEIHQGQELTIPGAGTKSGTNSTTSSAAASATANAPALLPHRPGRSARHRARRAISGKPRKVRACLTRWSPPRSRWNQTTNPVGLDGAPGFRYPILRV